MKTEERLAIRCKEKDATAQEELFNEYGSLVFRTCKRYVSNEEIAKELMLDTFMKVYSNISRFSYLGPGSLTAWIKKIAIHMCISHLRKSARSSIVTLPVNEIEHLQLEDAEKLESIVPMKVLVGIIDSLPDMYRITMQLYCIDGYSHSEIAEMLGIKESSSASNLHRARSIVAEKVKEYIKKNG